MDQGVRAASLPEVVDGGQHRRRAPGATGQRLGLGALLVGIAVATVAVPPLITPGRKAATPPVASGPTAPIAELVPAVTASPPAPAASSPTTTAPAKSRCAVQVTATPACAIFTSSLGNGWSVKGDGMRVLPGETVPDTKERAMRVERSRPALPATALTLTPRSTLGIGAGDHLKLRVWGGREFGTVLKLSVAPGGTGALTLTAPADKWTSFTIKLADLTGGRTLSRIDLAVAADQVPNVNRFFLDDIALTS